MEQIRTGLKDGIDISKYAKPEISYDRMLQIRLALLDNIDLSAFTKLEAGILKQLHLAIKNNVRIVPYILRVMMMNSSKQSVKHWKKIFLLINM